MTEPSTSLVALREARERAVALLSDDFAHDRLDVDEFERQLDLVHRASTVAEIEDLVRGAHGAPETVPPERALAVRLAPSDQVPERRHLVAVLSGARREGTWLMPRHLRVVAILGGIQLDLREATLAPGVSEISLVSFLGGTEIIVPPGLAVEMEGSAILGGFDHLNRFPAARDPEAPMLRISGLTVLGGVHVETRLPGETERDTRRRLRAERRQKRRELRAGRRAGELPPRNS